MGLTSYVSDSELFRQVGKRRTLKHPTAAAFDAVKWLQAFGKLADPERRDLDLMLAAIYYGDAVAQLRAELPAVPSEPLTRERSTRLLVAVANEQFLSVRRKSMKSGRKLSRLSGMVNLEQSAQATIDSSTGQSISGDDLVTPLIDTIHLLAPQNLSLVFVNRGRINPTKTRPRRRGSKGKRRLNECRLL